MRDPEHQIAAHHSPVRAMWSKAQGTPYTAFESLEAARGHPDAAVVLEADFGGQILATCPVRHLGASEQSLARLLADLECLACGLAPTPDCEVEDAAIRYEVQPVGSGVLGGCGGGAVIDGVWVHPQFVDLDLHGDVEAVLRGRRATLDYDRIAEIRRIERHYGNAERPDRIVDLDWNRISKSGWTCTHCGISGAAGTDFRRRDRSHRHGRHRRFIVCAHCGLPQALSWHAYVPCPQCGGRLHSDSVRRCTKCGASW